MVADFIDRRASLILGTVLAALALLLYLIAADGILDFTQDMAARRPVEVRTGAGAAIAGAVILALLAAILSSHSFARQRTLFRAVLWLSPLLVLLPLALWLASEAWLPRQGYARCAPLAGQRFLTSLWVPSGTACPTGEPA